MSSLCLGLAETGKHVAGPFPAEPFPDAKTLVNSH